MSKKVIYTVIAIVVVALIALGAFLLGGNNKEVALDLQQLNTALSEKAPFNEMATMDITSEELSMLMEVNAEDVEAVIGKIPMMNVHASMYLVIEAKEGSVETVKEKVDAYAQAQETQWQMYLPEQYELVKQRKSGVVGNYVYLIIAETSAELEELITK